METKDILKSLRKKAGYNSGQEFCKAADISFNTYQNYEAGKRTPTAEILIKIADFYGVTTDYLLCREPAPNPFANFNLSEDDEAEVAAKYMSLPPEIRACLLDVLIQLGDAAKKRQIKSVQSNAQSQSEVYISKTAARNGEPPGEKIITQEELDEIRSRPDADPDM